jgi:hypothetical protein
VCRVCRVCRVCSLPLKQCMHPALQIRADLLGISAIAQTGGTAVGAAMKASSKHSFEQEPLMVGRQSWQVCRAECALCEHQGCQVCRAEYVERVM